MLELIESVKKHGVLVPAIARPKPDGGYELVAGHRRQRASQLASLDCVLRDFQNALLGQKIRPKRKRAVFRGAQQFICEILGES